MGGAEGRGAMLTADGRVIDYRDEGVGPAVLFVPGSFSTTAAWRPIQQALPPRYRMTGISLCGYGATDERRSAADAAIAHEVDLVAEAARHVGGPVHLVGHSFGGTVALAAALSGRVDVASVATFEANPLCLVREAGHPALFDEIRDMSRAYAAEVAAGMPDAAARIIDFWGGEGTFAAMPAAVQDYCRATAPANALDWESDFGFAATAADYASLPIPVLLVRGGRTIPAMTVMTDTLAAALPDTDTAVVEGAGHFLISSHAADCAQLLGDFLDRVAG